MKKQEQVLKLLTTSTVTILTALLKRMESEAEVESTSVMEFTAGPEADIELEIHFAEHEMYVAHKHVDILTCIQATVIAYVPEYMEVYYTYKAGLYYIPITKLRTLKMQFKFHVKE